MTRMSKYVVRTVLAATAGFAILFATDKIPQLDRSTLLTTADARVGRPATPMSYAGAARRTARRGAYVAGAAAGAAAASGCYQVVDAYGRIYTRCQ
jgi:hypothetical protein